MATTITWHGGAGGNGHWGTNADWLGGAAPLSTQDALFAAAPGYAVSLDTGGVALDVQLDAGATLDISGVLTLGGTLAVATGALLQLSGEVNGGTLDSGTGAFATNGGTLAGVTVLGGFQNFADLTIDDATAVDSATGGTIAALGTLSLQSGVYDTMTFLLDQTGGGTTLLSTAPAAAVEFGASSVISLTQNGAVDSFPLSSTVAGLAGSGAMQNDGTITSDVSNPAGVPLQISVASFTNTGLMQFTPLESPLTGSFTVGTTLVHGVPQPVQGQLDWTAAYAPTLDISSSGFVNTGSLTLGGGTLELAGATVANFGNIFLYEVATQTVTTDGQGIASIATSLLPTEIDVSVGPLASAGAFSNKYGTLSADRIVFGGSVTLDALGTLQGALVFAGTLDLGGGTLDASAYPGITITGTVENGTITAGSSTLTLDGATLSGVTVLPGVTNDGPVTLLDPAAGSTVTLDGTTTGLSLSNATTADLTVFAGSTAAVDTVWISPQGTPDGGGTLVPGGSVTLASTFTLADTVAGSTVDIAGPADTVIDNGAIALDAATMVVSATLDGAGTFTLADNAALTLEALAVTAAPTVSFGAGVSLLVLPGTGALGLTIDNLQAGDRIDFLSVSSIPSQGFGTGGAAAPGDTLDVQGASGDQASLPLTNPGAGLYFHVVPDGSGGSLVEVACFAAGTRIAVPGGQAAVESLRPGDKVQLADGAVAPVKWIGCTWIDIARHPDPARVAPIRIRAEAVAPGLPARDLWVSPEHCLLIGGALIPAGQLTNGATIARDDGFARIQYWHVELERHGILLAENLPAESYLDTGNRALFQGEAGVRALHPDLAGAPDAAALAVWAAQGAAPLRLDAADIRARLTDRAQALGWRRVQDGGVTLSTEAGPLAATRTAAGLRALAPAGTRRIFVASRTLVPAEQQENCGDTRRLGVAVRAARLAGWALHPDAFALGWHGDDGAGWRWSDGAAVLMFPRLARATVLELDLVPAGRYWLLPFATQAAVTRRGAAG